MYLTIRLSKPAYIKIPILNFFDLEILGLCSIILSTRGKVCVKSRRHVVTKIGHLYPRLRETYAPYLNRVEAKLKKF